MKKTLQDSVLSHLKSGKKLTALSAFHLFGTMRLADVIFRLRAKGFRIATDTVLHKTKHYGNINIARYRLSK